MTTDNYERDFTEQGALKRPGRIDLRLFQNIDNAGDGYPGLQKMIRNWVEYWVKYYLHNGVLEQDLDLNLKDINSVTDLDVNGVSDLNGVVDIHSGIDMNGSDIDNIKNIDENIWFCSTGAEIQTAIDTIGANAGLIILQSGTIDLGGTKIDVDQSGSYIIMGQGNDTVIDCGGDNSAFDITSCTSCILRDFKIDASDISTSSTKAINITEGSNYPVLIDNVYVYMPSNAGIGIYINSQYVIIFNTTVDRGEQGINCSTDYCKIINNIIKNQTSGVTGKNGNNAYGIYNTGDKCTIKINTIYNVTGATGIDDPDFGDTSGNGGSASGIYTTGDNCIISDNIIYDIVGGNAGEALLGIAGNGGNAYGIYNSGVNCSVGINVIESIIAGDGGDGGTANGNGGNAYGIAMNNGANGDSSITGNIVDTVTAGDAGAGGGAAGAAGSDNGLDDLGASDYNIWTCNNARGEGEGINDGNNSINANNIV